MRLRGVWRSCASFFKELIKFDTQNWWNRSKLPLTSKKWINIYFHDVPWFYFMLVKRGIKWYSVVEQLLRLSTNILHSTNCKSIKIQTEPELIPYPFLVFLQNNNRSSLSSMIGYAEIFLNIVALGPASWEYKSIIKCLPSALNLSLDKCKWFRKIYVRKWPITKLLTSLSCCLPQQKKCGRGPLRAAALVDFHSFFFFLYGTTNHIQIITH